MVTAIIGAATAIIGALIGAAVAVRNERRRERTTMQLAADEAAAKREAELKSLALDMAKTELARQPDSEHSLAAHFMVIKTLLAEHDVAVTGSDEVELADAHQAITRAYQIQCQVPLPDGVDVASEEAKLFETEQALKSVAALKSVVTEIDQTYCEMCGASFPTSAGPCRFCVADTG